MINDVDAWLDFDRLGAFAVSPDGAELVYVVEGRLMHMWLDGRRPAAPLGTATGVTQCFWRPAGRHVLISVDPDGRENFQLVEIDLARGTTRAITGLPDVRHEIGPPHGAAVQPYRPDSAVLAYASNRRDPSVFDVIVHDLASGRARVVHRADDRHYPLFWSPDGSVLLVVRRHQNTEQTLLVCDPGTGAARTITPGVAKWVPAGWSADGAGIYLATDHGRDRLGVAYLEIASGQLHWIDAPDHDIPAVAMSPDRRRLAWLVNDNGYTRLRVADLVTRGRRELGSLPDGVAGRDLELDYRAPRFATPTRLVLAVSTPTHPTELYTVDTERDTARRLTSLGDRVPHDRIVVPERVHHAGVAGTRVPAWLYRPPGATAGKPAPVVVFVHGGPEFEHYPEYVPEIQALLQHGIGAIAPNIVGSTGNGTRQQRLIYRDWGGGDVADIANTVAFLRELPWVDASRLGICGDSYGGFVTLCCLVRMPENWKAAVDVFGPADLVALIADGPPHWRRRQRGWTGDPDDPDDLARLRDHSPLTHADRITTPLLVVHGDNDPRVPPKDSHRLVERLRELGRPVKLRTFTGEGHGFADRANWTRMVRELTAWFTEHLATGR